MQSKDSLFKSITILMLVLGVALMGVGLLNASLVLAEKGYYAINYVFGLFALVSYQKGVRDKYEGLPVSNAYQVVALSCTLGSLGLLAIGLLNADGLALSEKGYFLAVSLLSFFSAIVLQKTIRDHEAVTGDPI